MCESPHGSRVCRLAVLDATAGDGLVVDRPGGGCVELAYTWTLAGAHESVRALASPKGGRCHDDTERCGNVLEDVGFPLPVTIIGEMLGVPEADRPQFRGWVRDLVAIFEMQPTAAQLAAADAAQLAIRAYFLALIAEKRTRSDAGSIECLGAGGERRRSTVGR